MDLHLNLPVFCTVFTKEIDGASKIETASIKMSFLSELIAKKNELGHVETKVTTVGGDVFLERRENDCYAVQKMNEASPGFVLDTKPDMRIARVLPGLLMGSQDVVSDYEMLKLNSITHVLNVKHDSTIRFEGISYSHVPLLDLPEFDLLRALPQCVAFIDGVREQGATVYVHCNAGVSRSAAVVIAYMMQDQHLNFHEAYRILKEARPAVRPNDGFINQLKLYERELDIQ